MDSLEELAKVNIYDACRLMIKLQVKLSNTCYHDIYDAIHLWLDAHGTQEIMNYALKCQNNDLHNREKYDRIISTIQLNIDRSAQQADAPEPLTRPGDP